MIYGNVFLENCTNNLNCDISPEQIKLLREICDENFNNEYQYLYNESAEILNEGMIFIPKFVEDIKNDARHIAAIIQKDGFNESSKNKIKNQLKVSSKKNKYIRNF